MLSWPATTPPPPPPPVRADAERVELEPDEQWKADLRKRIEYQLRDIVADTQILRNAILNSQPSENSRKRALAQYDKSMGEIRILAQEEFNRQLRQEMSERKWALKVVDSNSPDVALQQQWILDNTHKSEEERRAFVTTDDTRKLAGDLSSSPPRLDDVERVSDGSFDDHFEDGFGSAGSGGEGRVSDALAESGEEEEDSDDDDDDDEEEEEDSNDDDDDDEKEAHVGGVSEPRQLRLPSRPHTSLVHSLHSKPTVSRSGPPSRQRHPSNNQPPEDCDEEEEDTHGHPLRQQRSQQYVASWAPRRPQGPDWRQTPRATIPSSISRAQNRDRIVSLPLREQQTTASASPHDRPSPPSYPIVTPRPIPSPRPPQPDRVMRFPTSASPSSRAIYGMQRSLDNVRQGIVNPRGPTTPDEGPRGASWGSNLHSRRSSGDFNAHRRHNNMGNSRLSLVDGDYSDASDDVVSQLDDRYSVLFSAPSIRSMRSMRSIELEQLAIRREAEARRKEEDARRLEDKARQSLEVAERLEKGARQAEASAKLREAAARKKETEAKLKETEAKKREAEAQKRETQAQHKEGEARVRELAARRKEVQARQKEEDARKLERITRRMEEEIRRKEEEAKCKKEEARRVEESFERKRREIEQKEVELKKRENELLLLEDAARRVQ